MGTGEYSKSSLGEIALVTVAVTVLKTVFFCHCPKEPAILKIP